MRIGVLGTGMVGSAIATKLVSLGHEVTMGSREAGNEKAQAWVEATGGGASEGSFADAGAFGELVVNCTAGVHSLEALERRAGRTWPARCWSTSLDLSGGMPPTLALCNTDSLGEQIQRAFPETKVVKALNTMNCEVMVDPAKVPGEHTVFVCGEDADAKRQVGELLGEFGWPADRILDLGGIRAARGYRDVPAPLAEPLGCARHRLPQHRRRERPDVTGRWTRLALSRRRSLLAAAAAASARARLRQRARSSLTWRWQRSPAEA